MAGGPAGSVIGDKAGREIFECLDSGDVVTAVKLSPVPPPSRQHRPTPSVQQPSHTPNMPPKRIHGEKSRRAPKGYLASTYDTLTSPDNSAVVLSIAAFGAAVTFLASSWGELLLPPQ
ncbi:hypothetical protein E4U30_007096 [Claviceps sp. LM220 group G6]|nr:hypothetical protein E4U30_007096 [Claviceps sp. LM220 group G6]KAG6094302.1 hypothetical protein E4U31_006320 [Claviceps sp. LM219 group G6]